MNNQYYTYTHDADELSYTGILTVETEHNATILTKYGEMTFSKNDAGSFNEASRDDFEKSKVVLPELTPLIKVTAVAKLGTKTNQASDIIKQMGDVCKLDIITALMHQLQITKSNANIYYTKLNK